jgi:hypothetical protein
VFTLTITKRENSTVTKLDSKQMYPTEADKEFLRQSIMMLTVLAKQD